MAKDYFQDIVPPQRNSTRRPHERSDGEDAGTSIPIHTSDAPERSIRNISAPARARPLREPPPHRSQTGSRGGRVSRFWIWGTAVLCLLILVALLFVALRPTRVSITPRAHTLTFSGDTFVASPESVAELDELRYSIQTVELDDSEVVQSSGVVYGEDRASGTITVYNNYQTEPLRLVKNTRFETPSGLIFRSPAEIVVPGKKGSTPGSVDITVVADQPGEQYNVAAGRFTLPGLRSTPAMYSGVYAESSSAFTGGFKGERPGIASADLERAIAQVRARLEAKARDSATQVDENVVAFPELVQIEYQSMPNTTEAGGGVRIHQKARVRVPIFPKDSFTGAVGASAIAGTDPATIELIPGEIFMATPASTSTVLGTGTLHFTLDGSALLVWRIDEGEIQAALAGKDKGAFETIIAGFPSVQEASARIEPFWRNVFPQDPADISIKVESPEMTQ